MKEWRENNMMKHRWPDAYQVIEILENAGFEAYVVGGAVRDFIRNVHANDVDVTTNATPNEVKQLFDRTIDVGIEHGTVLVILSETIEVTTFRSEDTYTDFRRPDKVMFVRSLEEDLQRRDFTMNAMALTKSDELIDYFGGRKDIENKRIRAVGDPQKRFSEDALRMLRAIRFSAQLDFSLHKDTLEAIQTLHHLIEHVSIERVKVELEKIWTSNNVEKGMHLFVSSRLANNFPGDWETFINKWGNFNYFENRANGWAFFSLMQPSEDINSLLNFYKCSNAEKLHVKHVLSAVEKLKKGPWTKQDFYQFNEEVLIVSSLYAASIFTIHIPYTMDEILQLKKAIPISSSSDIVVNGNDLMNWKQQKRGPWIKEVLNELTIAIINGQVKNERKQIKEWFFREFINGNLKPLD
ncbi:CCA tRNA nucleotidyltransferase [Psychrobacillus vulpis]|uniref:CCA-adding enzyme n=1 Tax=Psychrobacillus vulpis TaxID=2325572 RepID=A0A544TQR9_9BACI|nr:CCA tRNA nucleotidyltransferase [Psychrobacillus vulpis]TQR19755.1 CCA tRNA nucleotidyltransferase [Psychrobacillus vulpis]